MKQPAYHLGGSHPKSEGGHPFIELYEDLEICVFSPFGPAISMKLQPVQALKFAEQLTRLARTQIFGAGK